MKKMPATQVAFVDIAGEQCEFPTILQAYDAVYDWIKQNGYRQDGSPWEIYTAQDGSEMQIALPFQS
jgi:effector-binding domain-containing protein